MSRVRGCVCRLIGDLISMVEETAPATTDAFFFPPPLNSQHDAGDIRGGSSSSSAGKATGQRQPIAKSRLQIAPMMDVTYKDFRQFIRLLTAETQLWTEMWVDNTLLHADRVDGFLEFGANEHPIVCQLGGSCPSSLGKAAKIVESWGYDEINLNCGCPSDRVAGKGEFGASLMLKPELVRDCMRGIMSEVRMPATVKCRLGCDDFDSPEFTANFVRCVSEAGVRHFIIHARKCILKGLTPDQNRRIPPLMYDRVFRLCREFPHLEFSLNGGINTLDEVRSIMAGAPPNLVGVMIGRAAMNNPCILANADRSLYGRPDNPPSARSRHALLSAYAEYLDHEHPAGGPAASSPGSGPTQGALKPVLGVFNGLRGNKIMRQGVDRLSHDREVRSGGPGEVLRQVMALLEADAKAAVHLHEPLVPPPTVLQASARATEVAAAPAGSDQRTPSPIARETAGSCHAESDAISVY